MAHRIKIHLVVALQQVEQQVQIITLTVVLTLRVIVLGWNGPFPAKLTPATRYVYVSHGLTVVSVYCVLFRQSLVVQLIVVSAAPFSLLSMRYSEIADEPPSDGVSQSMEIPVVVPVETEKFSGTLGGIPAVSACSVDHCPSPASF